MNIAVVGHVEWVRFARVPRMPRAGEIVHASETWEDAGGGGAVAAVQVRKLAGRATFLTTVGDDDAGRRSEERLRELGVDVRAARREGPHRLVFTHTDDAGERTITVLGDRIVPGGEEALPWDELAQVDAVYFTGGDAAALRACRAAPILVAAARAGGVLVEAGVELDVVVGSASDPGERFERAALLPRPRLVVLTEGARGGRWYTNDGGGGRFAAVPPPGPREDAYGCGDSFAAALTYGVAAGRPLTDTLELAARCGAACLTGRGPYAGQVEFKGV